MLAFPFISLLLTAIVIRPVTVVAPENNQPEITAPATCYCRCQQTVDNSVETVDNFIKEEQVDSTEQAYTDEELEILAIIIYQEAGGDDCSDDTRRKVGSVFLNRVNSPQFPNTFKEVATQKRQYGTLYWTGLKWPDRASLNEEAHAVERAYAIAEELLIGGSILPSNVIWQAEFKQGDGIYCHQDNIYFCYSEVNK